MTIKDFIKQLKGLPPNMSITYNLMLVDEKTKNKMAMTNDIPKDEYVSKDEKEKNRIGF